MSDPFCAAVSKGSSNTTAQPMSEPGYYKCLRGDSEHLAMFEPDAFAILDARGRNWICYPIPQRKVENLSMVAHVTDVFEADAAATRHGLSEGGTEVRIYFCEDVAELFEKLSADASGGGKGSSLT